MVACLPSARLLLTNKYSGVDDLDSTHVHTYASFQYSNKTGVYITFYYSPAAHVS